MTANVGTVVVAPIVPNDSADTYPTHFDYYGFGGYASVATFADLAAIPSFRRTGGMQRYVQDTGLVYVLAADLTTWNGFDPANAAAAAAAAEAAAAAAEAAAEAAEAISLSVKFAPTRPDLLALPIPTAPTVVKLGTFNNVLAAGDFVWDPTSGATVVPGMCEMLTAQAPGSAGRLVRLLAGAIVSACMTGAYANNVQDDSAALQAANDYANANALECTIENGDLKIVTTINVTAPKFTGRGGSFNGSSGQVTPPTLYFTPAVTTDEYACLVSSGAIDCSIDNVNIVGPTNYSLATLQPLGFVDPTQVVTSVNNSGGLLLKYSAYAAGPVGFQPVGGGKTTYYNCQTSRLKVGMDLHSGAGHIYMAHCLFGGLNGIFVSNDSFDYYMSLSDSQGVLNWVLYGDTAPGTSGGGLINWTFNRCHFGFCPYVFNQCQRGATPSSQNLGIDLTTTGCSVEQIGEAFINGLPNALSGLRMYGVSGGTGFNSVQLPSNLLASNLQQMYWARLGTLQQLIFEQGTGAESGTGDLTASAFALANNPAPTKVAVIYIDSLSPLWGAFPNNSFDGISVINGVYNNAPSTSLYAPTYRYYADIDRDKKYVYKSDLMVRQALRPAANLFKAPDFYSKSLGLGVTDNCSTVNGGNWARSNGAVTIDKLSSWLAAGEFAASTISSEMWDFGTDDFMVVKYAPSAAGGVLQLQINATPTVGSAASANRPAVLSFFYLKPSAGNLIMRLSDTSGATYSARTVGQTSGLFLRHSGVNIRMAGTSPFLNLLFQPADANPIYIALPMLNWGEIAPFNSKNAAHADALQVVNGAAIDHIQGSVDDVLPTCVAGTGAGTGPTITVAAGSNDKCGMITVLTGATPGASQVVATLTYAKAYKNHQGTALSPHVILSARNPNAMRLSGTASVCVSAESSLGFSFSSDTTSLAASTSYQWNYQVMA